MIDSIFSDDVPSAVTKLQNDLRVLLDRRGARPKRRSSGNVVEFARPADKTDEELLIEAYQAMAGETADFFYKEDLSFEDYQIFREKLKQIYQQAIGE